MTYNTLRNRGFMFILSSPSGAGKTTLSRLLMQNDKDLVMSVSSTTRKMRQGEIEEKDYYFIEKEEFKQKIDNKFFYEWAEVFGNFYGTPKDRVLESLDSGKDVLFDIDWQGTRRLTEKNRDDIVSIFILPPSMKELKRRLKSRAQDSEEVIQKRMDRASEEISHWNEYDYVIVNDDIDASLQKVLYILKSERLKKIRQKRLEAFVDEVLEVR